MNDETRHDYPEDWTVGEATARHAFGRSMTVASWPYVDVLPADLPQRGNTRR